MDSTWKLHHVGIPVRDLDAAREDYESTGMASFQPEFLILSIKPAGRTKRSALYFDTRSRFSNLIVELIQAN